jgi:predicted Zn-dependent protease
MTFRAWSSCSGVPPFVTFFVISFLCVPTATAQQIADASTWASQLSSKITQYLERQGATESRSIPLTAQESRKKKYDVDRRYRDIGRGSDFHSLEQERRLGSALAREIDAQSKLIHDPLISEYLNGLAQSLVSHSDARLTFTIRVIESDEVNAFALPGGYLYVNSGLIMASDNEAEVASILAHEIAHVVARHAARSKRRQRQWKIAAYCSGPAGFAVEIAGFFSSMKSDRDAEREADLLGLEYQYATGYDPESFVRFLRRLHVKGEEIHNPIVKALVAHPMTDERIRRAQKEIATMLPPKVEYILDTSEFQQVKSRLVSFTDVRRDLPVLRRHGAPDGEVQ